jgi:uncharacterized protein YegJ (DUF2314 family)
MNGMRLPTLERDHFEIGNGEELSREHPDSFRIPKKEARKGLKTGDGVKLIFRMEETAGSDEVSSERMWVGVTHVHEGYYQGVLHSDPMGSECVKVGQLVYFQSCHVIDIFNDAMEVSSITHRGNYCIGSHNL